VPADRVPPGLGEPDSCAVSDALDRLGLPGAVTGLLPLTVARRIAAAEAGMLRRIRAGEPVSQVLSAAYEDMLKPGS
jgi:hypothetical protein